MAFKLMYYGKVVKDARSESEGSDATDDADETKVGAADEDVAAIRKETVVADASTTTNTSDGIANGVSKDLVHRQLQEKSKDL